jgi:hypothetical protein
MSSLNESADNKMNQAWAGLRRMGQPVIFGLFLGKAITRLNQQYPMAGDGLLLPAVAWPLVGLAIASTVNMGIFNLGDTIANYVYYGLIGVLAACATIASPWIQFFFEQLNDGILKGVFNGTVVPVFFGKDDRFSQGLTYGLCTMVGFHTLYTMFQRKIYKLAFEKLYFKFDDDPEIKEAEKKSKKN